METTQTRTSRCATCVQNISITAGPDQRWRDVEWEHEQPADHVAVPELRICVDATCPGCSYPEIGFAPARVEFICSRCGHTQTERPKD